MPHLGHFPGLSSTTSASCTIGQTYEIGGSFSVCDPTEVCSAASIAATRRTAAFIFSIMLYIRGDARDEEGAAPRGCGDRCCAAPGHRADVNRQRVHPVLGSREPRGCRTARRAH